MTSPRPHSTVSLPPTKGKRPHPVGFVPRQMDNVESRSDPVVVDRTLQRLPEFVIDPKVAPSLERLERVPPSCTTPKPKALAPLPSRGFISGDEAPQLQNPAKPHKKALPKLLNSIAGQDEMAPKDTPKAVPPAECCMVMAGSATLGMRAHRNTSQATEESPSASPSIEGSPLTTLVKHRLAVKKEAASSSAERASDLQRTDSDLSASDEGRVPRNSMDRLSFGSRPRSTSSWHTESDFAEHSTLSNCALDCCSWSSEECNMVQDFRTNV